MTRRIVSSWGNVIRGEHEILRLRDRFECLPQLPIGRTFLPFGNARSYGDSCLNVDQVLLEMRSLDRFISFDREHGVLACEAGVLLEEILRLIIPTGWFLPVVPGTQKVTVGGAIANDVHGKNHHRLGTFGRHVRSFELLRSTGDRLSCSPSKNSDWFSATIGGLGLTGIIVSAELQLRPIMGPWMDVESLRFNNLAEFFELSDASNAGFEYVVSWVDSLARGKHLGRGILQRAAHSQRSDSCRKKERTWLNVPVTPPFSLVNRASVRLFNVLHYSRTKRRTQYQQHFSPFFFPLDGVQNWNRLYGRTGFYQYQCVIPQAKATDSIAELLQVISRTRNGSFLAVLKHCGADVSPGMLSFPQKGVTLAMDFPNTSDIMTLLSGLDVIVSGAGGRLYPAKDGRMSGEMFRQGYPRWREFANYIDPLCSSNFWRRVMHNDVRGEPEIERRGHSVAARMYSETGA